MAGIPRSLYRPAWPEVWPAANMGYRHGIDPAQQIRYTLNFSNVHPLPTPPSSPQGPRQSIPHPPASSFQENSSSPKPVLSSTGDISTRNPGSGHSYAKSPTPRLQGKHISNAYASVSADSVCAASDQSHSPILDGRPTVRQPEIARGHPSAEDCEPYENSHVSHPRSSTFAL